MVAEISAADNLRGAAAPRNVILQGDVLDRLRELPDESVQCVVTSPPYWNLRDYGVPGQIGLEATPGEWLARMVAVFAEVRRVLREDGTLWLNIGDCYATHAKGLTGDDKSTLDATTIAQQRATSKHKERNNERSAPVIGLKDKDLIGLPWMLAFALRADGWYLRSDIVWCLSGGTRVYARTQKGEMPTMIKDLARLDPKTVQLWNGERWTQVLGWNMTERDGTALELTLRSGERIGCTLGHQWPTQRGLVRSEDLRVGDVIQTCRLPEPEHPKRPAALDDKDVGWLVGLYIAEGSRSGATIQIAGHVKETARYERLCRIAEAYHGTCRMHRTGGSAATINLNGTILSGIIDAYVGGKTAKGKHLAPRAWERSNEFLRGVLDGYLSGDGGYDALNDRWRLGFTRNYAWEADLRTLCARIGAQLTLNLSTVRYDGRDVPTFRGEVRCERRDHWNARDRGEIVAIGASKARQFWDIGVADEPHTFALASGVLTHNSKPNPMPEAVTDRPTRAHEYLFLLAKSRRYHYDADAIREPIKPSSVARIQQRNFANQTGGAKDYASNGQNPNRSARKTVEHWAASQQRKPAGWANSGNHTAAAWATTQQQGRAASDGGKLDKRRGHSRRHAGFNDRWDAMSRDEQQANGANKRDVWTIATQPFSGAHFATFPTALVEPCIAAGSAAQACEHCGAPWGRVVEVSYRGRTEAETARGGARGNNNMVRKGVDFEDTDSARPYAVRKEKVSDTTGWAPSCRCEHNSGASRSLVLDPFGGSGTVGVVCRRMGRDYLGIELNPAYVEMAQRRIEQEQQPMLLYSPRRDSAAGA